MTIRIRRMLPVTANSKSKKGSQYRQDGGWLSRAAAGLLQITKCQKLFQVASRMTEGGCCADCY